MPLPADLDLAYYFAIRSTRTVRADHCITFERQVLQLDPGRQGPSLAGQRVSVHVVPEGTLHVYHGQRPIPYQPVAAAAAPPQPCRAAAPPIPAAPPKSSARQRAWLFGQG